MRPLRIAALLAIALAVGVYGWRAQREAAVGAPAAVAEPAARAPAATAGPGARGPAPGGPPPPASLRDSAIDGALIADADGHFVPGPEALALFDYFLSATGEEPEAQLRARIVAEIERRLPAPAAREAIAFLDRYLAYRADAARAASDDRLAESADLERRLQWIREVRREHFGAELATTLFGDDERAAEIAIAQRRVAADASLSDAEKRAQLDALEAQLPESAREARAASSAPLRLEQAEAALRARGGSDAEVRALREETVGAEAAARLEALDQRRAEWNARLAAYRAARDAVLADPSRDAQAREAAIEDLLARNFDARERIRVRALDATQPAAAAPPP